MTDMGAMSEVSFGRMIASSFDDEGIEHDDSDDEHGGTILLVWSLLLRL